jgi:hypothetical protein
MYILEKLVFQGTEQCPQYLWKQIAMCQSDATLERILEKQRRPEDWRIVKTAFDWLTNTEKRRRAA